MVIYRLSRCRSQLVRKVAVAVKLGNELIGGLRAQGGFMRQMFEDLPFTKQTMLDVVVNGSTAMRNRGAVAREDDLPAGGGVAEKHE